MNYELILSEVEKYIDSDPLKLALKGVSSEVCNQIKYLNRAKTKLPSYYDVRAIIPSLSYEQSSSEATAKAKYFGTGELSIDLTCGLGVDSYYISKNYSRHISIEQSQILCEIANINFGRLKAQNIEVVNSSAEQFLIENSTLQADLIYCDPARRDNTKKVFLLEDCSPDMNRIMPLAIKMARKVVVKLSPMFDVDAARDFFSKYGCCTIESVSLKGECKEVVVVVDSENEVNSAILGKDCAVVCSPTSEPRRYSFSSKNKVVNKSISIKTEGFKYIYIPDVAFYKGRTVENLIFEYYSCLDYYIANENSPVMSDTLIENFEGEAYRVVSEQNYKPKELKKVVKQQFGSKAKILKRDFQFSTEQIKRELSLKDGASPILLFTARKIFVLEKI